MPASPVSIDIITMRQIAEVDRQCAVNRLRRAQEHLHMIRRSDLNATTRLYERRVLEALDNLWEKQRMCDYGMNGAVKHKRVVISSPKHRV